MNIHTTVEKITPALAKAYLEANTTNRSMRDRHVQKLASDIANGRWQINGASIVFNGDGTLLDGQHRLAAIVKADVPVEMLVVRGVSKSAMQTIDNNIARSAGDVARLNGFANSNNVVGIARLLMATKTGRMNTTTIISTSEIIDFLHKHPRIQESCHAVEGFKTVMPVTISGTWHYLAFCIGGFSDDVARAVHVLETGIPDFPGDPIHIFRERVLRDRKVIRGNIAVRMQALWTMCAAWNDFVKGEKSALCRVRQTEVRISGVDYSAL
jgi:hypothetical protein